MPYLFVNSGAVSILLKPLKEEFRSTVGIPMVFKSISKQLTFNLSYNNIPIMPEEDSNSPTNGNLPPIAT